MLGFFRKADKVRRSRPRLEMLEARDCPTVSATDTFVWDPGQTGGPGNNNWSADHYSIQQNKFISNWWDVTTNTGTGTTFGDTIPGSGSTVILSGPSGYTRAVDADCNTDVIKTVAKLTIDGYYTHTLSVTSSHNLSVSGAAKFFGGSGATVSLSDYFYSEGGLTWSSGLVTGSSNLRLDGGSPNWIGGTDIGGTVYLNTASPELATTLFVNTSTATTYIGFYASSFNFQIDSSGKLLIGKGTVVLCQDQGHNGAGNNGTSGGITGALGSVEVMAGGTLKRELFARSSGDAPNATAVKIVPPVQTDFFSGFANGQLTVGDSLGLEIDGAFKNAGTLTLTGGSVLTAAGGFSQVGNPAVTNMAYGTYNSKHDTELVTGTAYFYAGVLDLNLNSAGKYGTFSVVALAGGGGNVQIGDSVGGTTCTVDLYYHDSTNNSVFDVTGSLTFSAASGSENSIDLTWQGASGHNTTGWLPIIYASTNANPGVNEMVQFFGPPYTPTATWYDSGSNHFLKVTW